MCFPVLVGLVVLGPVLLLLSAAQSHGSHGSAGVLAAVLLVMATVLLAARAAVRSPGTPSSCLALVRSGRICQT